MAALINQNRSRRRAITGRYLEQQTHQFTNPSLEQIVQRLGQRGMGEDGVPQNG